MIERRFLRPKEALEYIGGGNIKSFYRLLKAERLPARKIKGLGWRIDRLALDAMLTGEKKK